MKKIFAIISLAAVCLISCKKNVIDPGTEMTATGSLQLNITNLDEYITIEKKSGADASIDFSDLEAYDVVIDGPTKMSKKFKDFVGKPTELGSGNYSITVTSPATQPAAFEQPIYRAYEEFTITAGEVKSLDLTCTPYNCKVTIELSDNFKKELATYEVVIGNGLGELIWTKDASKDDFGEGKAGYFLPRGLDIKVKGHRSIDNTMATAQYFIEDPQPAEHHIIKLDAKVTGQIGGGTDGEPGISISVITTFNEKDTNIDIGDLDESYVDRPDFGDNDDDGDVTLKNEIIWNANSVFEPYDVYNDSEVAMTIKMPAGIASFVVKVDHIGFQSALGMMTDGGVPYIDLINDTVFAYAMRGGDDPVDPEHFLPLGDEIRNQTQLEFNLTCFIPMLCSVVQGETVSFILEAYDNNGTPLKFRNDFPTITMIVHEGNMPVQPEQQN